jgi:hypothetical protein
MPILHLLNPRKYVTDAQRAARLDICNTCPQLTKHSKQCKECGCFVFLKTKLSSEKCPLGKW